MIPELAQRIKEKLHRLDILILNAGAVFKNRATTVEGIERSMAVNHFAPIHLTGELLPLLKESRPCRVINVSAGAHLLSAVDLEDFNFERDFSGVKAYARSKMAAIMGFYEFTSQYPGNEIQFLSLHPGVVGTSFSENNGKLYSFFMSILRPIMRSPASGAAPVVHLALSPELTGKSGLYFNRFKETKSHTLTYSKAVRQKVWDLTWQKIKEITE
jgi:NAD(P)-dependent dehydrogenase (short-subunit alcohol dehydrogenase family)